VISREAKREMLTEKVAGVWRGNREHLPRSDRGNLFKWFESADLTRLWRIYARSIDERVKDWRGEHRANGGEKEWRKVKRSEERMSEKNVVKNKKRRRRRRKKKREKSKKRRMKGKEGWKQV